MSFYRPLPIRCTTYGVDRSGAAGGTGSSTTVLLADGSQPLTDDWDTGLFGIIVGGDLVAEQALILNGVLTPAQLTADTDNWAPTNFADASQVRISADAARTLTGIAGGVAGRTITLINVGSFTITLADDATSTAANRFALAGAVEIPADGAVLLQYDGTSSRWRVIESRTVADGAVTTNKLGAEAVTQDKVDVDLIDLLDPPGTTKAYFGSTEPTGHVFVYGQAISRTTYPKLFAAYGTTYGVGDGSTTFNLPDARGRALFGRDNMGGSTASRVTATSGITGTTLGAVGGDERLHGHNHTQQGTMTSGTQSADHTHTTGVWDVNGGAGNLTGGGATPYGFANRTSGTQSASHTHQVTLSGNTTTSGAGNAQNMPPAIICNVIVRLC